MPIVAEKHPAISEAPPDGAVIWRFMSLPKYLSMLSTGSLYFVQASVLAQRDPFEGRHPVFDHEIAQRIRDDADFAREHLGEELGGNAIIRRAIGDGLNQTEDFVRRYSYVNCWSASEFESAALWSVYAAEAEGIAIRSTVGNLRRSLSSAPQPIYLGAVQYLDYRVESLNKGNLFHLIFSKRKSYAFEGELRACTLEGPLKFPLKANPEDDPPGILIPCDLSILIEEVYVAPFSASWFRDAVVDVSARYGLAKRVVRSSITEAFVT